MHMLRLMTIKTIEEHTVGAFNIPSTFMLIPITENPLVSERTYDVSSNRSMCPTIRSAAFPSHSGGIVPFFHCPAINHARAGGSLVGSVPISSFVPIVIVSGRSVLFRRLRMALETRPEGVSHSCSTRYSNGRTRALARWGSTEISAPASSSRLNCLIAWMSTG